MDFTTIIFPIFLVITFGLWKWLDFSKGKVVLMVASFIFYSYWFPPYLLLLLTSGLIDYWASQRISRCDTQKAKKKYLIISIVTNLSILGFFKYANFFLETVGGVRGVITGAEVDPYFIQVILPVGISFYTFQSISYTVDVYRGKLEASRHYLDFFLYLSFFPQLVAGPIVRAIDFLPQLKTQTQMTWDDYRFALYKITRGYFLKVYIADQIASHSNEIFSHNVGDMNTPMAWVGAVSFSVQIFCDFSGYSDIAIGVARLFGFNMKENFNNPYYARGMEDFWRRWHISLSTWFRDYLYIPLGGSRGSKAKTEFNVMAVFIVSGFWHGANWTFMLWGVLHGISVFVDKIIRQFAISRWFSNLWIGGPVIRLFTLVLVIFLWVPFRAPSVSYTVDMWMRMVDFSKWDIVADIPSSAYYIIAAFAAYCALQFFKEAKKIRPDGRLQGVEMVVYFAAILIAPWSHADFIYFQF